MNVDNHQGCCYLKFSLFPKTRNTIVSKIVEDLRNVEFDAIAITGYSASIIGSIVAHELKKNLIVVRKVDEDCASFYRKEITDPKDRIVFIDDLCFSGTTLHRILQLPNPFVGYYFFCSPDSQSAPFTNDPSEDQEYYETLKPLNLDVDFSELKDLRKYE